MRVEMYKRHDRKWAWRLVADNGHIIATDGGQGYENRSDAMEMATKVIVQPNPGAVFSIEGQTF